MFPFEEYAFNLGMLEHIKIDEPKNIAATRVQLVFYSNTVELRGEQAQRFIARAREAKWLDTPHAAITDLVIPTTPLRTLRDQRGG